MSRSPRRLFALSGFVIAIGVLLFLSTGEAEGYDRYTVNTDATNCAATGCHAQFNSGSPYTELGGTHATWPNDLMSTHLQNMVGGSGQGDCDTCHSSGGRSPVFLNSSTGGTGLLPISCVGCHGRLEDATSGTQGACAGLRQRHYKAGITVCANCHADAIPASVRPVGENTQPPYYANPGTGHIIPADPCSENRVGDARGLDNDGDGFYDALALAGPDFDCTADVSPGEPSAFTVTAHDPINRILTLSYNPGCSTTENTLVFGPLDQISTYTYTGQECFVPNSGTPTTWAWSYPIAAPDSMFLILVGSDFTYEGTYGMSSADERPANPGNFTTCFVTKNNSEPCP